jgi:hypothetical protein
MAEQIVNSAQSTLNGTINNVVTSLTVANGAVFPATGNFRILVCDPVTFANPELMLCTARASNVLTVTRGIETTTAVGHTTGALVTHVATVAGLAQFIAEHSVAQTIIDAKGDILAGSAADTIVRKAVGANATVLMADSTQSDGLIWGGTWQAYTPTWSSTGTAPALGNGTLTGRWVQFGKTVHFFVRLTMGSTTTFGTGAYFLTVPTAAHELNGPPLLAHGFDTSAGLRYGAVGFMETTTAFSMYEASTVAASWGQTVPVTWANGDVITASGTYESA